MEPIGGRAVLRWARQQGVNTQARRYTADAVTDKEGRLVSRRPGRAFRQVKQQTSPKRQRKNAITYTRKENEREEEAFRKKQNHRSRA